MIYLKRNNEIDKSYGDLTHKWVKPGYIYQLVRVIRFYSMPATVTLKVRSPYTGNWLEISSDINCFDYVKEGKK